MYQSEKELESLIKRITSEIVSKIMQQPSQIERCIDASDLKAKQLLIIISDTVMNQSELIKHAESRYSGYQLTIAAFKRIDDTSLQHAKGILNLNDELVRKNLANTINNFEELCFLSPGLKQMQALAAGDDSGYFESLVIYSLLHKKKTVFLLDYEVESLPSNSFVKKIKGLFGSISEMGISIDVLRYDNEKKADALTEHKKLITQKDIEDICKSGAKDIFCEKGCIITPLAKDRAKEMGINIVQM